MNLDDNEIKWLKLAFRDLLNYESSDPDCSIDPLTYRDPGGDNCLHIAAYRGNSVAVQLLLKAGLDVNSVGEMGSTPLHYASQKGHFGVVKILMANGALKDIHNKFGELPIVY